MLEHSVRIVLPSRARNDKVCAAIRSPRGIEGTPTPTAVEQRESNGKAPTASGIRSIFSQLRSVSVVGLPRTDIGRPHTQWSLCALLPDTADRMEEKFLSDFSCEEFCRYLAGQ